MGHKVQWITESEKEFICDAIDKSDIKDALGHVQVKATS